MEQVVFLNDEKVQSITRRDGKVPKKTDVGPLTLNRVYCEDGEKGVVRLAFGREHVEIHHPRSERRERIRFLDPVRRISDEGAVEDIGNASSASSLVQDGDGDDVAPVSGLGERWVVEEAADDLSEAVKVGLGPARRRAL